MIDLTTCPPPPEARELLEQFACTGQQGPFEEIVRRYGGMVFGICYDVTKNRQDAEDATQAAFLTLAVQARRGNTIHAIGPWLQQVARRMSLDINRSRKRRRTREDIHGEAWNDRQETLDADGSGNGFGQAPESAAGWDELRNIIRQELHELPPKYRLPLILHYYGGMSRDDMAKELGCRANTLGVRLHRARQLLGKRLAKRGITMASVVVGVLMSEIVQEAVTQHLIASTAQAAAMLSAGHAYAPGVVSAQIIHLARDATHALAVAKFKLAATLTLLAGGAMAAGADIAHQAGYIDLPAIQIIHQKVKDFFSWPAPDFVPRLRVSADDGAVAPSTADAPAAPVQNSPSPRIILPPVALDPPRIKAGEVKERPDQFDASDSPWWSGMSPVAGQLAGRPVEPPPANARSRIETQFTIAPQPAPVAGRSPSPGNSMFSSPSSGGSAEPRTAAATPAPEPKAVGRRYLPPPKLVSAPLTGPRLMETISVRPVAPPLPLRKSEVAAGPAEAFRLEETPRPFDPLPTTPEGGIVKNGTLTVTTASTSAYSAASYESVVSAGPGEALYRIEGQHVTNDRVVIGEAGIGAVEQVAGIHTVDRLTLASQKNAKGLYRLDYGQLVVTAQSSSDPTPHALVVGGAGEGTFFLGNANTAGTITQTGDGAAPGMTVGSSLTARGTVRGWGKVELAGVLANNGQVIAEGYGQERTLDLTKFSAVTRDYRNRDTRGWYARAGGRLDLPALATEPGTASYTWGDAPASSPITLINSARLTLKGAQTPGEMLISLLATDRGDIPQFPAGHTLIGVWSIDAHAADGSPLAVAQGADLLVRYDSALAAELHLRESVLKLWTFEDGQWIRHDFDSSFVRNTSTHTVSAHLSDLDFTLFAVSAPEPGFFALAAIAAGILTLRRRPRR